MTTDYRAEADQVEPDGHLVDSADDLRPGTSPGDDSLAGTNAPPIVPDDPAGQDRPVPGGLDGAIRISLTQAARSTVDLLAAVGGLGWLQPSGRRLYTLEVPKEGGGWVPMRQVTGATLQVLHAAGVTDRRGPAVYLTQTGQELANRRTWLAELERAGAHIAPDPIKQLPFKRCGT